MSSLNQFICLPAYLPIHLSVCLPIHSSIPMSLRSLAPLSFKSSSGHPSVVLFLSPSLRLSITHVRPSVHSVLSSIPLSLHHSIDLSIHLSVCSKLRQTASYMMLVTLYVLTSSLLCTLYSGAHCENNVWTLNTQCRVLV